jgi:hypothetical protein
MDKISFNLDPGEWHLTPSEAVWAERLIEKHSYEIRNIPYFVKGISYLEEIGPLYVSACCKSRGSTFPAAVG